MCDIYMCVCVRACVRACVRVCDVNDIFNFYQLHQVWKDFYEKK